jgi:hypothetical protein
VTEQGQIVAAPAPQQYPFQSAEQVTGAMPTTGRWGWYRDHEGVDRRRTSTLVKEVETDNHGLDKWKLRQILVGAARRGDLVTAVKAMGSPDPVTGWSREQKKLLDELAEKATEAAKDTDGAITGTAMHTMTERLDRGEPLERVAAGLPAAVSQSLRAYAKLRELNGWRTVEIERTVECEELEVRGTFDRVEFIPGLAALLGPGTCQYGHGPGDHGEAVVYDGELPVVVDVKTEKDPTLNGLHIGPQLAIYSRARKMWRPTGGTHELYRDGVLQTYPSGDPIRVPNGEYVPAPCVRQDVAIVVHVFDGDANPLLLNLTEGWDAAVAAYEQINRKARAKRRLGAAGAWFAPLPARKASRLETFVETAAAKNYADPYRPGPGQVGEQVTVGGIDFTRIAPAEDVGRVIMQGVEQVAVTDPATGLVSWSPATPEHVPASVPADDAAAAKDVVRGQLVEAVWKARTVDALAILWNMANDRGVPWAGPIAMAGDARRRQIECVQRSLHNEAAPTGSIKCACGWMAGQIA